MKRVVLLMLFVLVMAIPAGPTLAYLRVHPENPHYFQETTTGKPVLIASCAGVVPTALDCDYKKQVKEMAERHITYGRVWHFLPWGGTDVIWPWARSSTPGAHMGGHGGNKFDMNTWNPEYWSRMSDAMARCAKAGIYAEIHLFDRCGMSPAAESRWANNPWASDNNINSLETPDSSKDGTPDFYLYAEKPNLRHQQERYVRKMIDETVKHHTVIYEIENEHWQHKSADFAAYWAQFVKDYIAEKYPDCPRLVSYSSLEVDLEDCYDIPQIDIVNRHYGKEPERNLDCLNEYLEPRWSKNKPINIDEFANGLADPNMLRKMCWIIVASGGHFHIEDAENSAKPYDPVENIRLFLAKSGWGFIRCAPNKALVTEGGGYCMAEPGKQYVFFFPQGGSKKLNLAAGDYRARWWDTRKNKFSDLLTFSHAGGDKSFTTPDAQDWVLFMHSK